MMETAIREILPYDINTVWTVLRNVEDYPEWRSDVSRTEIPDGTVFIEYGKNEFQTVFTITKEERPYRWEFDIDNANISGHWTGMLQETENGTEVAFTEAVSVKKFIFKPFVKTYLKRQQSRFLEDLKHQCEIKGDN